jgi:hypothetical protein
MEGSDALTSDCIDMWCLHVVKDALARQVGVPVVVGIENNDVGPLASGM